MSRWFEYLRAASDNAYQKRVGTQLAPEQEDVIDESESDSDVNGESEPDEEENQKQELLGNNQNGETVKR